MGPEAIIHHLSKLSNDTVQEAQPDKSHRPGFISPYKDGRTQDSSISEDTSTDSIRDASGHLIADISARISYK